MKLFTPFTKRNERGFTLVETLVAIAILTTAIIGPFVAIQIAVTSSYVARDQLTATMLAQEGIEYARAVRDGNYLYNIKNPNTPVSWLYGLDGSNSSVNCVDGDSNLTTPYFCTVDPLGATPIALCPNSGTGSCPVLNQNSSSVYTQTSGAGYTATHFTRKLSVIMISANEARVVVYVLFTSNHGNYSVFLDEHLYNWL